jgi:hypothetical protein
LPALQASFSQNTLEFCVLFPYLFTFIFIPSQFLFCFSIELLSPCLVEEIQFDLTSCLLATF